MSALVTLTILDKKNGGQGSCVPLLEESGSAQHRHLAVWKILGTAIGGFGESAKKTACAAPPHPALAHTVNGVRRSEKRETLHVDQLLRAVRKMRGDVTVSLMGVDVGEKDTGCIH